jgi:3,4-dihydroxy 2-butanone 4-phosphate synthase/GTP cyclohydrolase II
MARMPQLEKVAEQLGLHIVSIEDLIAYRLKHPVADSKHGEGDSQPSAAGALIERGETVELPTEYGYFRLTPFRELSNGLEHIVLTKGEWAEDEPILCRVHSSCMTGDIFGSKRCECGEQLQEAMRRIEKEGKGILVYLNQEGRGIGLMNKIKAYKLQEQGDDTIEANIHLGFDADERDYGVGAQILRAMGAKNLRLMTNNPVKRIGLESYGIVIVQNIAIEVQPNPYNLRYMRTKKEKMHHTLHLV